MIRFSATMRIISVSPREWFSGAISVLMPIVVVLIALLLVTHKYFAVDALLPAGILGALFAVAVRLLSINLAPEVWLAGEKIVVKIRGVMRAYSRKQIVSVDDFTFLLPPRIRIIFQEQDGSVKAVHFIPRGAFSFWFGCIRHEAVSTLKTTLRSRSDGDDRLKESE